MIKKYSLLIVCLVLSGCASTPEGIATAVQLYDEAQELNAGARYAEADAKFEELASTYPTSIYTEQSFLDQIASYLYRKEYTRAIDTADEFLDLFPDHPQISYVLYMKGVIYFREDRGVLDRIGQQDPAQRDPHLMRLSFRAFRDLIERYPDSPYSADAVLRMRYLVNALAKSELYVANYYYRRGGYLATIHRINDMLNSYPDSIFIEDALALLVQAYEKIGAISAAKNTQRLLEANFPKNQKK